MPSSRTLAQLPCPSSGVLPVAQAYVGLIARRNGQEACVRLLLSDGVELDIPLSRNSLVALAHDLRKYLYPKPLPDSAGLSL
jgi:hypothetical protein